MSGFVRLENAPFAYPWFGREGSGVEIFGLRLSPLPTPIYTELIQCFQKVNIITIHGINLYPVDNSVACTRTYPLNSDFFPWITPCNSSTTGNTPSTLPFSPLPLGFSPQIKKQSWRWTAEEQTRRQWRVFTAFLGCTLPLNQWLSSEAARSEKVNEQLSPGQKIVYLVCRLKHCDDGSKHRKGKICWFVTAFARVAVNFVRSFRWLQRRTPSRWRKWDKNWLKIFRWVQFTLWRFENWMIMNFCADDKIFPLFHLLL